MESHRTMLWARLIVNHTKKMCALVCAVPLLALVLILAANLFTFNTPTAQDYYLKQDLRTRLDNAREAARDANPYESPGPLSRHDTANSLVLLLRSTDETSSLPSYRPRSVDTSREGINLLTREGLAFLKAAEDRFIETPRFERFCLHNSNALDCDGRRMRCALPNSLLNDKLLYGRVTRNGTLCGRRKGAELVTENSFNIFIAQLFGSGVIDPKFATFLGKDLSIRGRSTQIVRTFIPFGTPIAKATGIITTEQKTLAYNNWATAAVNKITKMSNKRFHVTLVGETLAKGKFDELATKDFMYASVSLWLVFFVAWFHTSSLLLSTVTLVQILLSFPLTYLVYNVVLQIKYFAALQIMTIFLILGIGADDSFVFTDAWKQSTVVLGQRSSLEQRMSWTYRRAGRAMGVTSLTTAAAFFVTATSPIMPIATLGAWAGVLVLAQYALVLTLFPCAVIMWHRYWRLRHWKNCLRRDPFEVDHAHEQPLPLESAVEDGQAAAEVVVIPAPSPPPSAILQLPQLPRTSVLPLTGGSSSDAQADDITSKLQRVGSSRVWPTPSFFNSNPGYVGHTRSFFSRRKQREDEYRPLEKFFNGPWTNVLRVGRWPIVVAGMLLVAGSIYCATLLEAPSEQEAFLPDGDPVQTGLKLLSTAFPPQSGSPFNVKVQVVWGISGIDRTGTSKYDPQNIGRAVPDQNFSLTTAPAQWRILEACNYFNNSKKELLDSRDGVESANCWIKDFLKWRNGELESYTSDQALYEDVMSFSKWTDPKTKAQPYLKYVQEQRIGLDKALRKVIFTELEFVSRMSIGSSYSKMWPEYKSWQQALDDFSSNTKVKEVKRPFVVGGAAWKWQITQKALIDNMFLGIGVVFAVALIALSISTGNWIVSLLSLASICGILSNLLALIWLLGWSLGITESIGVVFAVGLSFDYVAHVTNAFVDSKAGSRAERVRDALTDVGISVAAGAASTLLAGSMLFVAKVPFFFKFGVFIVATVALSSIWALVYLPALLHAIGPVGSMGELRALLSLFTCCTRGRKAAPSVSDMRFDIASDFCGSASIVPESSRSIADDMLVEVMSEPRSSSVQRRSST